MTNSDDAGKLIMRLALGILILLHGIAKIGSGTAGIQGMVAKAGLPGEFGYLVFIGEVLGPILVIIGLWTRAGAALIAINMLVAIWLVHTADLFSLGKTGGWALELQGMYLFTAIALMFLGAGRFSLGGRGGSLN